MIKIVVLLIASTSAGFVALVLVRHMDWRIASAFGIFSVSVPVDPAQLLFVSGGHSTYALWFILMALVVFEFGRRTDSWRFVLTNALTMLFLLSAIFASPTAVILPLVHFIWLGLSWLLAGEERKHKKKWILGFLTAIVVCIVGLLLLNVGTYHYAQSIGWTQVSIQRSLSNLVESIKFVAFATFMTPLGAFYFVGIGFLIGLALWVYRQQQSLKLYPPLLLLSINAFFAAAFVFGPPSIIVGFLSRYIIAPITLVFIGLFSLGYALFPKLQHRYVYPVVFILIGLTIVNFVQLHRLSEENNAWRLDTHNLLTTFYTAESQQWPDDAQVAIITNETYRTLTTGHNHWSTWYQRLWAKNETLIGLIGESKLISSQPFVSQYADHGNQFWHVVDGRTSRIQMIGFEYDRKTYVYTIVDDTVIAVDYLAVPTQTGTHYIGYGQTFNETDNLTLEGICADDPLATFFVWEAQSPGQQHLCTPDDSSDTTD